MSTVDRPGEGPPPPSPLTGGYLLVVLPQLHSAAHKDRLIHALTKGLITWDAEDCHVDLDKELQNITAQAPEGEEAKNGERLIQFASENLVTEVLIHPQLNTLVQCMRNCLSSFTRHRHIVHAGYTSVGNGAWILQDGTFSFSDFADMYGEHEVQRVLRAYEGSVSVDVHCSSEGDWWALRAKDPFSKVSRVRLNPPDKSVASPAVKEFLSYLGKYLVPAGLGEILEASDVVGNIRFSHPTLYVFPGGQGDAALFGINGFNMLVDGGFSRKSCFWDFTRHLDRLDSVLMTRINNGNLQGLASLFRRKKTEQVYPQIGHFFSNIPDRKQILSPDGDKDRDPLLINLIEEGQEMLSGLRHLGLKPQPCYRESSVEPINLYHKVGHGKLDMYVLSPAKDSREVREFLAKWAAVDSKIFCSYSRKGEFTFPMSSKTSICALLVWQPANPEDNITRILFPGSTPQQKIFEGLDRLKNLEFMKHPVCSAKSLSPSSSTAKLSLKSAPQPPIKSTLIEKVAENEKEKKPVETVKTVKQNAEVKKSSLPPKPKSKIDRPKEKPKTDVDTKQETAKLEKKPLETADKKPSDIIDKKPLEIADKKPSEAVDKKAESVDKKTEPAQKADIKKEKPKRAVQKPPERKIQQKAPEKKPEPIKSSPTTPKKTVDSNVSEQKPETKSRASKTKASPSATPAKSAKEANNRKVVELKSRETSKMQALKAQPPKKEEPKKIERPVKKPTAASPKKSLSPVKAARPAPKPKLDVKKVGKPEKDMATDSSAVSTPSTADAELIKAKDDAKAKEVDKHEAVSRKESKSLSKEEDEDVLIIEKVEMSNEVTGASDVETIELHMQKASEEKKRVTVSDETAAKAISPSGDASAKPSEPQQVAQVEVHDIIETATEIVSKKLDLQKLDSQEISGKDQLSVDKLTTPKEKDGKPDVEQKVDESQPDEKFSTTVESGATTTAPTLPEDERIPLDEIKEGVEEKYAKEETKEKDVVPRPEQPPTSLPQVPIIAGIAFDHRAQALKDIVKTPDEVADLPVHEEVDVGYYESDRKEDLLPLPAAKKDKKEETTEELKLFKDNLEKEDKSKDLKEDLVESTDVLSHTATDLDLVSSSPKSGKPIESEEKEEEGIPIKDFPLAKEHVPDLEVGAGITEKDNSVPEVPLEEGEKRDIPEKKPTEEDSKPKEKAQTEPEINKLVAEKALDAEVKKIEDVEAMSKVEVDKILGEPEIPSAESIKEIESFEAKDELETDEIEDILKEVKELEQKQQKADEEEKKVSDKDASEKSLIADLKVSAAGEDALPVEISENKVDHIPEDVEKALSPKEKPTSPEPEPIFSKVGLLAEDVSPKATSGTVSSVHKAEQVCEVEGKVYEVVETSETDKKDESVSNLDRLDSALGHEASGKETVEAISDLKKEDTLKVGLPEDVQKSVEDLSFVEKQDIEEGELKEAKYINGFIKEELDDQELDKEEKIHDLSPVVQQIVGEAAKDVSALDKKVPDEKTEVKSLATIELKQEEDQKQITSDKESPTKSVIKSDKEVVLKHPPQETAEEIKTAYHKTAEQKAKEIKEEEQLIGVADKLETRVESPDLVIETSQDISAHKLGVDTKAPGDVSLGSVLDASMETESKEEKSAAVDKLADVKTKELEKNVDTKAPGDVSLGSVLDASTLETESKEEKADAIDKLAEEKTKAPGDVSLGPVLDASTLEIESKEKKGDAVDKLAEGETKELEKHVDTKAPGDVSLGSVLDASTLETESKEEKADAADKLAEEKTKAPRDVSQGSVLVASTLEAQSKEEKGDAGDKSAEEKKKEIEKHSPEIDGAPKVARSESLVVQIPLKGDESKAAEDVQSISEEIKAPEKATVEEKVPTKDNSKSEAQVVLEEGKHAAVEMKEQEEVEHIDAKKSKIFDDSGEKDSGIFLEKDTDFKETAEEKKTITDKDKTLDLQPSSQEDIKADTLSDFEKEMREVEKKFESLDKQADLRASKEEEPSAVKELNKIIPKDGTIEKIPVKSEIEFTSLVAPESLPSKTDEGKEGKREKLDLEQNVEKESIGDDRLKVSPDSKDVHPSDQDVLKQDGKVSTDSTAASEASPGVQVEAGKVFDVAKDAFSAAKMEASKAFIEARDAFHAAQAEAEKVFEEAKDAFSTAQVETSKSPERHEVSPDKADLKDKVDSKDDLPRDQDALKQDGKVSTDSTAASEASPGVQVEAGKVFDVAKDAFSAAKMEASKAFIEARDAFHSAQAEAEKVFEEAKDAFSTAQVETSKSPERHEVSPDKADLKDKVDSKDDLPRDQDALKQDGKVSTDSTAASEAYPGVQVEAGKVFDVAKDAFSAAKMEASKAFIEARDAFHSAQAEAEKVFEEAKDAFSTAQVETSKSPERHEVSPDKADLKDKVDSKDDLPRDQDALKQDGKVTPDSKGTKPVEIGKDETNLKTEETISELSSDKENVGPPIEGKSTSVTDAKFPEEQPLVKEGKSDITKHSHQALLMESIIDDSLKEEIEEEDIEVSAITQSAQEATSKALSFEDIKPDFGTKIIKGKEINEFNILDDIDTEPPEGSDEIKDKTEIKKSSHIIEGKVQLTDEDKGVKPEKDAMEIKRSAISEPSFLEAKADIQKADKDLNLTDLEAQIVTQKEAEKISESVDKVKETGTLLTSSILESSEAKLAKSTGLEHEKLSTKDKIDEQLKTDEAKEKTEIPATPGSVDKDNLKTEEKTIKAEIKITDIEEKQTTESDEKAIKKELDKSSDEKIKQPFEKEIEISEKIEVIDGKASISDEKGSKDVVDMEVKMEKDSKIMSEVIQSRTAHLEEAIEISDETAEVEKLPKLEGSNIMEDTKDATSGAKVETSSDLGDLSSSTKLDVSRVLEDVFPGSQVEALKIVDDAKDSSSGAKVGISEVLGEAKDTTSDGVVKGSTILLDAKDPISSVTVTSSSVLENAKVEAIGANVEAPSTLKEAEEASPDDPVEATKVFDDAKDAFSAANMEASKAFIEARDAFYSAKAEAAKVFEEAKDAFSTAQVEEETAKSPERHEVSPDKSASKDSLPSEQHVLKQDGKVSPDSKRTKAAEIGQDETDLKTEETISALSTDKENVGPPIEGKSPSVTDAKFSEEQPLVKEGVGHLTESEKVSVESIDGIATDGKVTSELALSCHEKEEEKSSGSIPDVKGAEKVQDAVEIEPKEKITDDKVKSEHDQVTVTDAQPFDVVIKSREKGELAKDTSVIDEKKDAEEKPKESKKDINSMEKEDDVHSTSELKTDALQDINAGDQIKSETSKDDVDSKEVKSSDKAADDKVETAKAESGMEDVIKVTLESLPSDKTGIDSSKKILEPIVSSTSGKESVHAADEITSKIIDLKAEKSPVEEVKEAKLSTPPSTPVASVNGFSEMHLDEPHSSMEPPSTEFSKIGGVSYQETSFSSPKGDKENANADLKSKIMKDDKSPPHEKKPEDVSHSEITSGKKAFDTKNDVKELSLSIETPSDVDEIKEITSIEKGSLGVKEEPKDADGKDVKEVRETIFSSSLEVDEKEKQISSAKEDIKELVSSIDREISSVKEDVKEIKSSLVKEISSVKEDVREVLSSFEKEMTSVSTTLKKEELPESSIITKDVIEDTILSSGTVETKDSLTDHTQKTSSAQFSIVDTAKDVSSSVKGEVGSFLSGITDVVKDLSSEVASFKVEVKGHSSAVDEKAKDEFSTDKVEVSSALEKAKDASSYAAMETSSVLGEAKNVISSGKLEGTTTLKDTTKVESSSALEEAKEDSPGAQVESVKVFDDAKDAFSAAKVEASKAFTEARDAFYAAQAEAAKVFEEAKDAFSTAHVEASKVFDDAKDAFSDASHSTDRISETKEGISSSLEINLKDGSSTIKEEVSSGTKELPVDGKVKQESKEASFSIAEEMKEVASAVKDDAKSGISSDVKSVAEGKEDRSKAETSHPSPLLSADMTSSIHIDAKDLLGHEGSSGSSTETFVTEEIAPSTSVTTKDKTETPEMIEGLKTTGLDSKGKMTDSVCIVEKITTEKQTVEGLDDLSIVKSTLRLSSPVNGAISQGKQPSSSLDAKVQSGMEVETHSDKIDAHKTTDIKSSSGYGKPDANESVLTLSSGAKSDASQLGGISDFSMIKDMTASFISTEKWTGRALETPEGRVTPSSDASAVWRGESDDDLPASPLSTTSHVHSPPAAMFSSIYGQRIEDDDSDLDFETAAREHAETRGVPLGFPEPVRFPPDPSTEPPFEMPLTPRPPLPGSTTDTKHMSFTVPSFDHKSPSTSQTSEPKKTFSDQPLDPLKPPLGLDKDRKPGIPKDPIEKWGKPLGLPPPPPPDGKDFWSPFKAWGRPYHLPSPAPAPPENDAEDTSGSAKTTPKKVAKMNEENNKYASNIIIGKEANNKNKRSDSPVKKNIRDGKKSGMSHIYMDLSYVPHHGNSHYANVEFFRRVRARYYVFSGTEPSKDVFNALLEAKQTWEDKDLEVTIIPTYDTDTLGYWIAENEETLSKYKIDLSPSASRCTINLQDHDTSCSAYRLEF